MRVRSGCEHMDERPHFCCDVCVFFLRNPVPGMQVRTSIYEISPIPEWCVGVCGRASKAHHDWEAQAEDEYEAQEACSSTWYLEYMRTDGSKQACTDAIHR